MNITTIYMFPILKFYSDNPPPPHPKKKDR